MSSGKTTVLVVDDEDATLLLASSTLRRAGFRVLTASNGHQALAAYHQQPPELLVTDVVMPDMTGTELVEYIRDLGRHTRFLLMTGYGDDELRDYLQGLGDAQALVLRKPFTAADLISAVQHALEHTATPVFC